MKQVLLFTIFLIVGIQFSNAQTITWTDYGNWPNLTANKLVSPKIPLKKGSKLNFVFNKITKAQFTSLLANSTLKGVFQKSKDTTIKLSNPDFAIMTSRDTANTNSVETIYMGRYLNMAPGDSLTLTLNGDNKLAATTTIVSGDQAVDPKPTTPSISATDLAQYKSDNIDKNYIKTDVGYKSSNAPTVKKGDTPIGDNYTIHVFLDQNGNTLFASMPTGIQRKYHYMFHILLPQSLAGSYHYGINITSGSLSDAGNDYNSTVNPNTQQNAPVNKGSVPTPIVDIPYNFFPTSDDLVFTIALTADGNTSANFTKTYTIKKTNYYRGTFDVGVFKTWVNSPTYTLVNSPTTTGQKALKVADNGANIAATFMYTAYISLWNAIFPVDEKGFRHNVWGRTFLDDDGGFIRKIYPSIGIGLNGNVLTNWFAGLNFQPMQGFGIFAGANIRKINTFNAPASADFNNITSDAFNYYQNTKTRSDWAIGIILDTSIFNKIVGALSSSATAK